MTAKPFSPYKNTKHAVICGVLCLLMLVGLAFFTETDTHAAEVTRSGTCGDNLTWTQYSDGVLRISGTGAMTDYDHSYGSQRSPWYYRTDVKYLIVEEGVTTIGKDAFYHIDGLITASLPSTVTNIGYSAFAWCGNLKSINIPYSAHVSSTTGSTFSGCNSLSLVILDQPTIAGGITNWYDYGRLLKGSSSATVAIRSDITAISSWLTSKFPNVTSAKLGGVSYNIYSKHSHADNSGLWVMSGDAKICSACNISVDYVVAKGECGENATWKLVNDGTLTVSGSGAMSDYSKHSMPWYDYASKIKKVVISEGITAIGKNAFNAETVGFSFTDVSLPSTLGAIGDYAFYGCKSLSKVTLPASVNTVGRFAFRRSGLVSVKFAGTNTWTVGDEGTFSFADAVSALTKRYYNNVWTSAESTVVPSVVAVGKCGNGTDWTLSDTGVLTVSGSGAMFDYGSKNAPWASYKAQIKTVVIAEGVTSIGNCAFYEYASITGVSLPSTLTKIGDHAFYACKALTEITVPASVNSIGAYAFRKCTSLTTATFENADSWSCNGISADISADALKSNYKNAWTRA